jgi:hypothetical protein
MVSAKGYRAIAKNPRKKPEDYVCGKQLLKGL